MALAVLVALLAACCSQGLRLPLHMSQSGGRTSPEDARRAARPGMSWLNVKLSGVGAFAGEERMPNDAFVSLVETSDAWISKRTGIRSRHILREGTSLRDAAVASAREALSGAGVDAAALDLVIVATSSPDDLFGDAPSVAHAIGASKAAAFDLTAACSGFVFGLVTAAQFIQTGAYSKVLVVGADALTRFIDWSDRGSCILFGDGAGAVVVEKCGAEGPGLLGFAMHSDGGGYCDLQLKFNSKFAPLSNAEKTPVDQGAYGKLAMNGAEVYKFAVSRAPEVIIEALDNAGLKSSDVDWLLMHQANIRIVQHAAELLGVPMSKVLVNLDEYGNTSAASIPLCLAEAVRQGRVKSGDVIAMAGFGAGLSWSAAVVRWA